MSLLIYPDLKESGPENMATDFWLFNKVSSHEPIFRHYGWLDEEITFGYGQDWNWVKEQCVVKNKKATRRPTGGGIVNHGKDWTYMLIIPNGHSSFSIPSLDLYERLHIIIGDALSEQNCLTSLMPCPSKDQKPKGIPGNCFLEPVGRDLMSIDGRQKLAGAAMKRSKKGILIQGTIDFSRFLNLNIHSFKSTIIEKLQNLLSEQSKFQSWPKNLISERACLAKLFASSMWQKTRKLS